MSGGKESLHGFDGWLQNTLGLLLDGHTGLLNQLWKTLCEVLGGGVVLESFSPLLVFFSNLHDLVLSVVDRYNLTVVVSWLSGVVKIILGLVVISIVIFRLKTIIIIRVVNLSSIAVIVIVVIMGVCNSISVIILVGSGSESYAHQSVEDFHC